MPKNASGLKFAVGVSSEKTSATYSVCICRTVNSKNEHNFTLIKVDIPGVSLGNREPEKLNIAELQFWLQC